MPSYAVHKHFRKSLRVIHAQLATDNCPRPNQGFLWAVCSFSSFTSANLLDQSKTGKLALQYRGRPVTPDLFLSPFAIHRFPRRALIPLPVTVNEKKVFFNTTARLSPNRAAKQLESQAAAGAKSWHHPAGDSRFWLRANGVHTGIGKLADLLAEIFSGMR
jgi:hypothetical protein